MQFSSSTQAKSWIFSTKSLFKCKQRALFVDDDHDAKSTKIRTIANRVRKFASGFHKRGEHDKNLDFNRSTTLSLRDQEIMIQFHAHQIQFLIGPNAILYDLRTSEKALSTAIIFFRRFYLSNSIIDVSPRKIAAACAFFAAKVEEEKVEIGLIAHATALVQQRVHNAPLCCKELRAVSVLEIEYAERLLMEGLNYEFHCHHAGDIIEEIFANMDTSSSLYSHNEATDHVDVSVSPRSTTTSNGYNNKSTIENNFDDDHCEYLRHRALDIAQRADIFSDVPFLYAPCDIAFAIVAIVCGSYSEGTYFIAPKLVYQYMDLYPEKSLLEMNSIVDTIRNIIVMLLRCPYMDIHPMYSYRTTHIVAERAEELRRVMGEVASVRLLRKMKRTNSRYTQQRPMTALATTVSSSSLLFSSHQGSDTLKKRSCTVMVEKYTQKSTYKRLRPTFDETDFTPPRLVGNKCAKITPTTNTIVNICYHYSSSHNNNPKCISRNESL